MSSYDATKRPSVANEDNYIFPDSWGYNEADLLDAILVEEIDLPEVAEPLLYEEIIHEQKAEESCDYVRSLVEGGTTSVYTTLQLEVLPGVVSPIRHTLPIYHRLQSTHQQTSRAV